MVKQKKWMRPLNAVDFLKIIIFIKDCIKILPISVIFLAHDLIFDQVLIKFL